MIVTRCPVRIFAVRQRTLICCPRSARFVYLPGERLLVHTVAFLPARGRSSAARRQRPSLPRQSERLLVLT